MSIDGLYVEPNENYTFIMPGNHTLLVLMDCSNCDSLNKIMCKPLCHHVNKSMCSFAIKVNQAILFSFPKQKKNSHCVI